MPLPFGLIAELNAQDEPFPKVIYDLVLPDFSQQPKRPYHPFDDVGKYPATSAIFNQRRIYASTRVKPSTIFFSAIGRHDDFNLTLADDGAFELTLDSRHHDSIDYIVAAEFGILLFSERGVYLVTVSGGGGISVDQASSKTELLSGSKLDLAPLSILNHTVYLSNLDNNPRAIVPGGNVANEFGTLDVALHSQHFFDTAGSFIDNQAIASSFDPTHRSGAEIISWTYAGRPNRLLWAVRADGLLLSCTYAPEHQVHAWCKHATKGRFRGVQSVYEKNADTVYLVVERGSHKYIECLSREDVTKLEQSVPFDAAVRTANREPSVVTVLTIIDYHAGEAPAALDRDGSVGEFDRGFSADFDDVNVDAPYEGYTGLGARVDGSGLQFEASDLNSYIRTPGGVYHITEVISATKLKLDLIHEVPVTNASYFDQLSGIRHPIYQWEVVEGTTVENVYHLQHQNVSIVKGNGEYDNTIRLAEQSTYELDSSDPSHGVVMGLPFVSRVTTLPLVASESLDEGKAGRFYNLGLRCRNSSSMEVGTDDNLYPTFFTDAGEEDAQFHSGVFKVDVSGDWDIDKSLTVRSTLPFDILGLVINFDAEDPPNPRG